MGDAVKTALVTVPGSLQAQADATGASLAETFLSCEAIVIVDVSGSMNARDARGGRSRYDVACAELARLQADIPGKLGVIAFSTYPQFCPGGKPVYQGGGTDLAAALEEAHLADGCGIRFMVISDGEPNDEQRALAVAGRFQSRIDCIYIGPEGGPGSDFLRRLAAASGGQSVTAAQARQLAGTVERLLLASA